MKSNHVLVAVYMSYVNIVDKTEIRPDKPEGWLELHFFYQLNFDENMKGNSKLLITCNVRFLFALLTFLLYYTYYPDNATEH